MPGRARNQIQHDIGAGRVRVNDEARPASHKVRAGERIDYDLPEETDQRPRPEMIPLRVVFEDEHLIVIDKPAGLVVHPAPGHATGTLVNALLAHIGPSLEGVGSEATDDESGETGARWGIVHRLDALTSGLIMAAKTQPAYDALVAALGERRVRRQYLGLVAGYFKEDAGMIDRPIGRRRNDRKRMGIPREGGRPAVTDWRVLYQDRGLTLLALTLHTGRTHQIRVHMQSIGRPILGDPEYGWTRRRTLQDLPQDTRPVLSGVWPGRQMLHAARLAFMHPLAPACQLNCQSPPPADMAAVMSAMWGDIWQEKIARWQAEPAMITAEPGGEEPGERK
ncbi:MAG: RluA family pseudouridine synthase [bacterium]|nr:RluA family pseudouridine synthase [bacterium]